MSSGITSSGLTEINVMTGRDRAGEILTELSTIGVHLSEPVGFGFDEESAFSRCFHRS